MPTLHFDIHIAAPRERVWRTMLYTPTYERWTATFCEGSRYDGSWEACRCAWPAGSCRRR